jgi:hypothetical protein
MDLSKISINMKEKPQIIDAPRYAGNQDLVNALTKPV